MAHDPHQCDVLVIGSGAAGLTEERAVEDSWHRCCDGSQTKDAAMRKDDDRLRLDSDYFCEKFKLICWQFNVLSVKSF